MEANVFRLVNDAHASAANFPHDSIVRNGFADHNSRSPATTEAALPDMVVYGLQRNGVNCGSETPGTL